MNSPTVSLNYHNFKYGRGWQIIIYVILIISSSLIGRGRLLHPRFMVSYLAKSLSLILNMPSSRMEVKLEGSFLIKHRAQGQFSPTSKFGVNAIKSSYQWPAYVHMGLSQVLIAYHANVGLMLSCVKSLQGFPLPSLIISLLWVDAIMLSYCWIMIQIGL